MAPRKDTIGFDRVYRFYRAYEMYEPWKVLKRCNSGDVVFSVSKAFMYHYKSHQSLAFDVQCEYRTVQMMDVLSDESIEVSQIFICGHTALRKIGEDIDILLQHDSSARASVLETFNADTITMQYLLEDFHEAQMRA